MKRICSGENCERPGDEARGMCSKHYQRWRKTVNIADHPLRRLTLQELVDQYGVEFQGNGCIYWMGPTHHTGYGVIYQYLGGGRAHARRRWTPMHRYSYELMVGPIPDGMDIDHICRNRRCVNPFHLRPTTRKQNSENLSLSSRSTTGVRGVHYDTNQRKYTASVRHNRKLVFAGRYNTLAEAESAVVAKRLQLHTHNEPDRNEITHGLWWGVRRDC